MLSFLREHRTTGIFLLIALLGLSGAVVLLLVTSSGPPTGGRNPSASPTGSPGTGTPAPSQRPVPEAAAPSCDGPGRSVVQVASSPQVVNRQWSSPSPPDDTTYDLRNLTSTAYPSSSSPFLIGSKGAATRTCVIGGTLRGHPDDQQTWQYYHADFNGACVQITARDWIQVRGTRCDGVEDGIRPEENSLNANNTTVFVSGTYLTNVRDDCIENDFTIGGVLSDSLWDGCHTGISERPCCGRSWTSPPSETLTLDHMLIGLRKSPNTKHGSPQLGENSIFKWSSAANRVVIKCSIFKVDAVSINGTKSMAVPPGTIIDDSGCPGHPSTIVWLGQGNYPAPTQGLAVTHDEAVWTDAVNAWKAAHGYASGAGDAAGASLTPGAWVPRIPGADDSTVTTAGWQYPGQVSAAAVPAYRRRPLL